MSMMKNRTDSKQSWTKYTNRGRKLNCVNLLFDTSISQ